MEWQWILIVYLLFGILMGEGLLYHDRKIGKRTELRHYLIALLLGPVVGLVIIIRGLLGKNR